MPRVERMTDRMPARRAAARCLAPVVAIVMACATCHAARSEPSPSSTAASLLDEYALRQWTVQDGLPERTVQYVGEGPDGFFWVATFRHLLRFDGIRFVDVGSPGKDFDADPSERILRIHAAADGHVYLLTTTSLHCYGPLGWSRLLQRSPNEDADEWEAATLTGDARGVVHLSGGSGLVTLRAGTIAPIDTGAAPRAWTIVRGVPHEIVDGELEPHPVPEHDRNERAIHLSVTDDLPTVVTATTVYRWREASWEAIADRPPETSCVLLDRSGRLWCGGEQGIREYHRGRWMALETGAAPVNVAVRSILEDSGGTIWAATDGGLVRFRQKTQGVRVVPVAGPLPGIKAAWQADDGTIWAAPDRGGLVRLRSDGAARGFESVALPATIDGLRFEAILMGSDGEIWLGTDGAGLWHGQPGGEFQRAFSPAADRRLSMVAALAGDSQTRLWIGSGEGLFVLDPSAPPRPAGEPNSAARLVEAIFPDADGTLWVGRQGDWITQVDAEGEPLRRLDAAGLPQGSVWSFHRDRQGTLWAGGDGRLTRLTEPVAVFDGTHGLPEAAITQIDDSPSGLLWVGTRDGLFAGDLATIDRSPTRRGLFRRFDPDGPIGHVTCTGRINKRQRSDETLFPSAQGLIVLDSGAGVTRRSAPQAIIESVSAVRRDGSLVEGTPAGMIVPAGDTAVAVRFTAIHMAAPEALRFRYRVTPGGNTTEADQTDDDWTAVGRSRRVVLHGLPAGRHTLEVRASLDGKYATEGAKATLDVEALFWQRPGFIAASGAAGAAAVAAVVLAVVRQRYRRRLSRERELQQERERIARDIHDDLGAGLTQVAHLSAMAADHDQHPDASRVMFQRICTATTGLTRSLDEIVWAVNPANDSLDKLVSYLAEFAQEFASVAGVACRLDLPDDVPHRVVSSRVRHNVCMLLKESLNNAVIHGLPAEVLVTIRVDAGMLRLTILDDGKGFDNTAIPADGSGRHSGIPAMQHRVSELGGRLTIESLPGTGTTVDIAVEV